MAKTGRSLSASEPSRPSDAGRIRRQVIRTIAPSIGADPMQGVSQPKSSAIGRPWSVIGTGRPPASSSLAGLIPRAA